MQQNLEILNAVTHADLRMLPMVQPHPHCVQIIMGEFAAAATICPIFFLKDPETGQFNVAALFGFTPGQLLADGAAKGDAAFLPLDLVRQGFYADGENIAIDLAHPRFAGDARIALFDGDGQASDELRLIQRAIGALMAGRPATDAFVRQMVQLRLVEPVEISLKFDDGENLNLEGLYTISLDALNELDDAQVIELFRNGYLQAALTIQASSRQVGVMARRRNRQIAGL